MVFTCQRQSLETLLKHYFGNESYILDNEDISNLILFGQHDPYIQIVPDANSASTPIIICPSNMITLTWHDCEIYVPYGTDLAQVEALLRKYMFPGIRYEIIHLPVSTSITPIHGGGGGSAAIQP